MEDFVLIYPGAGEYLSLSAATTVNGALQQRFRKELIHVGKFCKASDGIEFEVTDELLAHWALTFSQMKENGQKVALPLGHTVDPELNRGWVDEIFVEDQSLFMIVDIIGKDAIELAMRNDVSLFCPVTWIDGKGNEYKRPIRHVALTPDPVIPGLKPFEAIAASHLTPTSTENTTMDLKKIQKAFGIKDVLTEETAETLLLAHAETVKVTVKAVEDKAKLATETADALKLSHEGKKVDDTLLSLAHDNRDMKVTALVEAAKISPNVAEMIREKCIGEDNAALRLSLETGRGVSFDDMVGLFKENDTVALAEQTGQQTVQLSQDGEQANVEDDKFAQDAMLVGAGGVEEK